MTDMTYSARATQRVIAPTTDQSVISEHATTVTITDEGAGEFVTVSQLGGSICFCKAEWPLVRDVIERMLGECEE